MPEGYETPHANVLTVVTGYFHQGSGYSAWREHGTRDWLLIYTVSGKGRFGHGGGEIVSAAGDWVLLRPGTLHDYGVESSLKQWELLWAHFHPRTHWLPLLAWPIVHRGLTRLRIDDPIVARRAFERFLQCHQFASGPSRNRELLAMNALEEVLLWCDQSHSHSPIKVDDRVQQAMNYLIQNLHEKLTLADVAEAIGLSVSRLSHLFKSETGGTPQEFLESQRLDRAAQMLQRTTFSIKQIAAAVGFDSPFYFSLRFKAKTRLSPKRYREEQRAGV